MKIAIDVSPIAKSSNSAHKVRGVGSYINYLVDNLPKYDEKNEYVFVEDKNFPSDSDLIHYPYFDPFFPTLPSNSPKKFIVTVHDLTPIVFKSHFPAGIRGNINWQIQKNRLKKASRVITDSNVSREDVVRLVNIRLEKVRTVYISADEKFVPIEKSKLGSTFRKYNLPPEFILYVGDATWNKNLPRLVEAVRATKYPLVMVGKIWESSLAAIPNNPWNHDLISVLKSIEKDSQFIRLGFVESDDIVKIYNLATCLIMPSIYEGFGLPVLEAMQSGTPVICSSAGSLSEIAGDAALFADHENIKSISSAIEKVMSDKMLRSQLIKKGLEQAKKFEIKKTIKNLIKIYELK